MRSQIPCLGQVQRVRVKTALIRTRNFKKEKKNKNFSREHVGLKAPSRLASTLALAGPLPCDHPVWWPQNKRRMTLAGGVQCVMEKSSDLGKGSPGTRTWQVQPF